MVAHLKNHHGAIDAKGLAEKWRHTILKNAWSCGFCVSSFTNLTDRLRHIDKAHFSRHQHISYWNRTNVIRGLLLQAHVAEAWNNLLTSYGLTDSAFTWNNKRADKLQEMLQKGPSPDCHATDLVKAVFDDADDPDTNVLSMKPCAPEFYDGTINAEWEIPKTWTGPSALLESNDGHFPNIYASTSDFVGLQGTIIPGVSQIEDTLSKGQYPYAPPYPAPISDLISR